jgi:hypothetical protein
MFEILENPFVFAIVTAAVAAVITFAYMKTIEGDQAVVNKSTFKVAFVVFAVNLAAMFLIKNTGGTDEISTEPFVQKQSV